MINSHKDLIVWQKSLDLVVLVYKLVKTFPSDETYGLVSQMRRASVSIPANIAEGRSRGTRKDFRHFVYMSYGSANELETLVLLAKKLEYKSYYFEEAEALLNEVLRMLNVLLSKLEAES